MTASDNTSTSNTSEKPEFITLDEAAAMTTGTRVTFIPGAPALYSEALKNICYAKGVPLIRVLHPMMGVDKATGQDRQARLLNSPARPAYRPCSTTKSDPEMSGRSSLRW